MQLPILKSSDVISRLHGDTLLIAASPRLANEWERRFLLEKSVEIIATPAICFWDAWISRLANTGNDLPVPLTKNQELLLWEKVIGSDLQSRHLPRHGSIKGLARRASEAFACMQEFRIDTSELALGGEEAEALARWIKALKSELEPPLKNKALGNRILCAELSALIISNIHQLDIPRHIIVDGFEHFTPVQQQLLDVLIKHGCNISTVQSDHAATLPVLIPCMDEASELSNLACHIQYLLDKHPHHRVAILTSDSFTDKAALRRELNKALMPEAPLNPFNEIHAVQMQPDPIADWPMIQQTLHLLSVAGEKNISFSDFSSLLFSPWLNGYHEERLGRAGIDALFRRQNRHRISFAGLLKSSAVQEMPALSGILQALNDWTTASRTATQWVKAVHTLLQTTGMIRTSMDSESSHSNTEVRLMNAFRDALTSLASVDAIYASIEWPQFLSLLRSACLEPVNIAAVKYPNVSVMPLSHIAGLRFDHIFVLALDEKSLPPAARPLPLLPLALQKKYNTPMSHGNLQFASSKWLWQQLLQAAPGINISYAIQRDEQERKASAFVMNLETMEATEPAHNNQPDEIETYQDAVDLPLHADENIRGGTAIIRNQSACPFRAFMMHRLSVSTLGDTEPGIEATTKGSLIHFALEYIWGRLHTQAALIALSENDRNGLVQAAIDHAWQQNQSVHNASTQCFEKKRMQQLLDQWLELESKRPPFRVVDTEKAFLLHLPENTVQPPRLELYITADRIDQDSANHTILIDYKTGKKQSPSKWMGERMEEPQLPLYAAAAKLGKHDAVTFATVRSGHEMGFEGLAGEDIGIDGIAVCDGKRERPGDWQQQLDDWKNALNSIAQEFVEGRSDVDPRDSKACRYCGLEAICRIEETGFDSNNEDDS